MSFSLRSRLGVRGILVAMMVVGGIARLVTSGIVPLVFDEYQWMRVADSISLWPLYLPVHGDAHPAGGAYIVGAGAALLGENLVGYRLGSVLAGTALIWIVWRLARPYGETAGLTAAALVTVNEYLFGVSRLATEESAYLVLSAASILAFREALQPGATPARWMRFGAVFGATLATKEIAVLWIPLFAWEIVSRPGRAALFSKGPAAALAVAFLGVVPDLAWNLFLQESPDSLSGRGLAVQADRFALGVNAGPSALFIRPFFHRFLEDAVSEYPSMTAPPGAVLLMGATIGLFALRQPDARMWLRLGWFPFLFFTFLGNSEQSAPEFWWGDLSVVPFILLTATLSSRVTPWLPAAVVLIGVPGLLAVATSRENCYPPAGPLPPEVQERCYVDQRSFVSRFPERDHVALAHLGSQRLPAFEHYGRWSRAYLQWLSGGPGGGVPWELHVPEERRAAERGRMKDVVREFDSAANGRMPQ